MILRFVHSYVVPLKAPSIVSADRTEATTALIEWEVLSQEDLRGNLSSHEIVYYELLDEDCPPNTTSSSRMVSFKGIEPQFVITDLDPGLQYCVGVAAKTGAGRGDFSYSLMPCKSGAETAIYSKLGGGGAHERRNPAARDSDLPICRAIPPAI